MASGSSVVVQDLSKRYRGVAAVHGVSLTFAAGEIFGLLGRNGAGKTTTLECILGLRQPDAGSVTVAGVNALAEPERARARVGAQLQGAQLQDKITPRQALSFFGSFYANAACPEALLEQFALKAKADVPFAVLSGGQKQRLFLALAFVHRPPVVVLDEPTAGLDPQARHDLHAVIRRLRGEGIAVLLSTHHLDDAEQLCDRVGILHEGQLRAVGTPEELAAGVRVRPSLVLRTREPLSATAVTALPGVIECRQDGTAWRLECTYVNQTLSALGQHLAATQNQLIDLRIERPTLEDVFRSLTGTALIEEVIA